MNNNNNNKTNNSTAIILVVVFLVLVSLGVGAYYFFFRKKDPVDCELGDLGAYMDCGSDNCPTGMNQYAVRAIKTEAKNGGEECPEIGERRVYRAAATDCSVGPWTAWQSCETYHNCPAGFNQRRTRTKTPATPGGKECTADENSLIEYQCVATQSNDAEWSIWTPCNHDCPTGKTHKRTHNVCANEVMYKTETAVPCTPGTVWSNWTACATTPSDACPAGKNVYRTNANCPETKEFHSMTAHEQAFHNQLNALGYTASNAYYTVCPASKTPTEAECRAIGDYAIGLSSANNYSTINSEYVPKCSWRKPNTNRVIKYNTHNENRNFYNTEFNQICKN